MADLGWVLPGRSRGRKCINIILASCLGMGLLSAPVYGEPATGDDLVSIGPGRVAGPEDISGPMLPHLSFVEGTDQPEDIALTLKLLIGLTVLAMAPSIILMVTSFTRVVIILSFLQRAIAAQGMPPRQVITSLAVFLTFFIMAPTMGRIKETAWDPYMAGEITTMEAYDRGIVPVRDFMLANTRGKDLALFIEMSGLPRPNNPDDVPTYVLIPAFMISEITMAFMMGVFLFIPFLVIDMVVASTLMSMGMIMLPPVLISLPFKILLFVLVDGWNLISYSIVRSYA